MFLDYRTYDKSVFSDSLKGESMNKKIENYNSEFKRIDSDKDVAEVVAFLNSKDGKHYIKIIVASGAEMPYHIRKYGQSEKGCYIRVGNSKKPMSMRMIEDLYSKRTRNSLSKIKSPRGDLTFNQLKIYYEEMGYNITDTFLDSLEFYTEDGKFNYNAYLLADNNSTSIKVAVYDGTNKVDLIESNEYGYCSLIKAINRVLDKLDVYNTTHTRITGKPRRDQWRDVDNNALREAVVNAVVHNDYASNEVPPVFEIFSDRLVITSMGGLPIAMTKDEFFKGISKPRNKVLMRVFKDMELVEQLGSGMDRILSVYDRSIFEISDNYIRVSFKYNSESPETVGKSSDNMNFQDKVKRYAVEQSAFKSKEIQELLNLQESRTRQIIAKLCKEGILERHGSGRGTYYTKGGN